MSTDVVISFDSQCTCSYSTTEGTVPPLKVCAVIQFINGTESTDSSYSVMMSPDNSSASAQST